MRNVLGGRVAAGVGGAILVSLAACGPAQEPTPVPPAATAISTPRSTPAATAPATTTPTPVPTNTPVAPTATPRPPAVSQVTVGVGTGTVAGQAFAPKDITVPVGSSVSWTVGSDGSHTVTFLPQKGTQPPGDARTWPVNLKADAPGETGGSVALHTGTVPKGTKVTVKFTAAGAYPYVCAIHPGMEGKVTVVEAGQSYTSEADAATKAKSESDAVLAAVDQTRQAALTRHTKSLGADGKTTWTVPVGPVTRFTGGFVQVNEYFPKELKIKAGDAVKWVAESGQTVTFVPAGAQAPAANSPAVKPAETYDGTSLYNSGGLGTGTNPKEFQLTFPTAGTFAYQCLFHGRLGHTGTIVVE